ncbi:MAG: hypothetical protein JWP44_132 [Mucilaginibacter sp.]|nr:hypothetical protein [Mucilaginibacter sp.]
MMIKPRICLFTAHSPNIGGGAVILRSLTENLKDFDIEWKYIAKTPAAGYETGHLGTGFMGSGIINDVLNTWAMLSDRSNQVIDQVVSQLMSVECDGYWIVSHNEGMRIALELSRRQRRPVHLTVHDDWEGALCARSVRYRFMKGVARKLTVTTLKKVNTADLISKGMQTYYQQLSGKKFDVCHRYLKPEQVLNTGGDLYLKTEVVNVGHIGSIYKKKDFIIFLDILKEYFTARKQAVIVHMWGLKMDINDLPEYIREHVKFYNTLPESQVIPELAKCAFVYSMYPLSKELSIFSKTSLPTKLSSYVQACRPIFGHCPADSTLAEFLDETKTGVSWTSRNKQDGFDALNKLLKTGTNNESWEAARQQYFGEKNLATMTDIFGSY